MKIQNNSIIHEINDKVYYKDELYQIKLIQEDLALTFIIIKKNNIHMNDYYKNL